MAVLQAIHFRSINPNAQIDAIVLQVGQLEAVVLTPPARFIFP